MDKIQMYQLKCGNEVVYIDINDVLDIIPNKTNTKTIFFQNGEYMNNVKPDKKFICAFNKLKKEEKKK